MALFTDEPERSVRTEQSMSPSVSGSMLTTQQTGMSDVRTRLDQGARVSGKLHFENPARIDGQVDGEVVGTDLTIGENAVVRARITAESIVVDGTATGEITAKRRIEIRPTAKVSGNITAPILVVHEGATFDGNCTMRTGANGHEAPSKEEPAAAQIDDHHQGL